MAPDFGFLPETNKPYYFISYNSDDSARVAPIVRYMNSCGVPFWYDSGLEYGKVWETQIASHIAECEAVLMFVTRELFYKENCYVRKEYDEAVIYEKKIIPVFLDDIRPSELPRHSVGFYIDLNRLHSVPYKKSSDIESIAKRAAQALEVNLRKPEDSEKKEPEHKIAPIQQAAKKSGPKVALQKKNKNTLIAILCALAALMLIGVIAITRLSDSKGRFQIKYETVDGGIHITRFEGNMTVFDIPSEIDGLKVTGIDEAAFFGNDMLTEVTIPEGVKIIEKDAFINCEKLKKVSIPDSVESIGASAFQNCTSLEEVALPKSLTEIDEKSFAYCKSLKKITFPGCEVLISRYAFIECEALEEVIFFSGITGIDDYAFYGCSSLQSISIPESVEYINNTAFFDCTELNSIYVNSSNEVYASKDGVLYNKKFTELIYYPEGKSEETFIIPDSVRDIEAYAFRKCRLKEIIAGEANTNFESIDGVLYKENPFALIAYPCGKTAGVFTMPDGVLSIGEAAFYSCKNLKRVNFSDDVKDINEAAFEGCDMLAEVNMGGKITYIGSRAFAGCYNLEGITIPDSVSIIGEKTFSGCYNLEEITIPDSVSIIGDNAFEYCMEITVCAPKAASNYLYVPDAGVTWEIK